MVSKFFANLKEERGITLIEIVVVIFIVVLFTLILIADFPKIQKQFALSRVTYKLAQDLRRAQDLGLSGVPLYDGSKTQILVKGYGVYIDAIQDPITKYYIYADVPEDPEIPGDPGVFDQKYSGDPTYTLCNEVDQSVNGLLKKDCIIEIIDIGDPKKGGNTDLKIADIKGNEMPISNGTSINFMPPSPTTKITDNADISFNKIDIDISNSYLTRTVSVNTSGLINVSQ